MEQKGEVMQVRETGLAGVLILEPKCFGDDRGFFFESFNARVFQAATGVWANFVQDNHSYSKKGIVRGLHYQLPRPQGKLVRTATGSVLDVVVDLRAGSPTLGRSVCVELSAQNRLQMWVPPGFAHGFQVLSEEGADFIYKTTEYWVPEHEHCIRWDDPDLDVKWASGIAPLVSDKDARGIAFRDAVKFPRSKD
jgi:dTDP-4-dehydrorhamnose 3,5-epimerase